MLKFGRNYLLTIESPDFTELVKVEPPLTIEFDSTRSIYGSANYFTVRVRNMSPRKRDLIRKDENAFLQATTHLNLMAGYGTQLSQVIYGNIVHAWTVREGTDYITEIDGYDGGFAFADSVTQGAFVAGTTPQAMIEQMVSSLSDAPGSNITVGSIGQYSTTATPRGTSLGGNTGDILREVTGGGFFVDNGVAHCLHDNECIEGEALEISSRTGLLGTPTYDKTVVHLDMIFDPRIKMAQLVLLQSETQPRFNGLYKGVEIHNRGTISESISGTAITSLGLVNGTFSLVPSADI